MAYPGLSAAIAGLSPAAASVGDALTRLSAQTTTLIHQPFAAAAAKVIAQTSANLSWGKIVQLSRSTGADVATLAAITIYEVPDSQRIDPTNGPAWAAWNAGIAALQAQGALSADDVAALSALSTATSPTWPGLTYGDVQTAAEGSLPL
jgi:hypothetical protein